MELRDYLRALRRRAWIPLVLTLAAVLGTGALVFASKPQYTATATVITHGSNPAMSLTEVATSNSVVSAVIKRLSLDETVEHLKARITVALSHGEVYRISVGDPNPNRASAVANAVAEEAASAYPRLAGSPMTAAAERLQKDHSFLDSYVTAATALLAFNREHPEAAASAAHPKDLNLAAQALALQLQQHAAEDAYLRFEAALTESHVNGLANAQDLGADVVDQAAAVPDTGPRIFRLLYAAALALVIGLGLIFTLEYMDNSVREPEQVEELLGAPVVGIIPKASSRTLRPAKGGAA
jgi:capsular polysaccharide biosynthesis protein